MHRRTTLIAITAAVTVGAGAVVAEQASAAPGGGGGREAGMVAPTVPITPSVDTYTGQLAGNTRTFKLTAVPVKQQIATFPIQYATVWGWEVTGQPQTASTPGPTLVAYEGEKIVFDVTNDLPQPTSLHPHGTHEPNNADGVAGVDFQPIPPGQERVYPAYTPGHAGTFAYHTHTNTAVQEPKGVVGLITILPKKVPAKDRPAVDVAMTLQQFNPAPNGDTLSNGAEANPMPNTRGMFPFSTINGKTGDASDTGVPGAPNGEIQVKLGDLVQIRLYNASDMVHSMHLHGMDMTLVDINGHPVPAGQTVTTKSIAPGEFFTLQFRATTPGNWIFHCSFPSHQANDSQSGYQGAPVGMLRIFRVGDVPPVSPQYFAAPQA